MHSLIRLEIQKHGKMIKDYINTKTGQKVKIDIDILPLSQAKLLKEVDPVKIPDVIKEQIIEVKRGRKPKK